MCVRKPATIGSELRYEQFRKSSSFGVTVTPGFTFKGFPFASKLVVIDGGEQSAVPPPNGTKAFAPTEYSTSPDAGAE